MKTKLQIYQEERKKSCIEFNRETVDKELTEARKNEDFNLHLANSCFSLMKKAVSDVLENPEGGQLAMEATLYKMFKDAETAEEIFNKQFTVAGEPKQLATKTDGKE